MMAAGSKSLLSLPVPEADRILVNLRDQLGVAADSMFVLATIRDSESSRTPHRSHQFDAFCEAFAKIAGEFRGIWQTRSTHRTFIEPCAWFPNQPGHDVVLTVARIQTAWSATRKESAVFAVADSEYAALKMLRAASDRQIVIQEPYLAELSESDRELVHGLQIHQPSPNACSELHAEMELAIAEILKRAARSRPAKPNLVRSRSIAAALHGATM